MSRLEPYASLGLAAAAGLLVGLEREWSAPEDRVRESSLVGGARTHPLLALVAAVGTLVAPEVGAAAVVVPFAALALLLVVNYAGDVVRDRHRGITSEAAFLLSFLLGVLAATRGVLEPLSTKAFVVSAVAVVATFLLSAKPTLHPLARGITAADAAATIKFLVVAVVVLPLLPDQAYGPFGVLNPFSIGTLLVLISGLSFAGYAAIRLLGPERGLGLTGLVGGLVSSTAVTLAMSGRAREAPAIARPAALAVMLASTVMFVRILVIAAFVNPGLERALAFPMVAAALAGAVACLALWRAARAAHAARVDGGAIGFSNPFELGSAVKFVLLFAAVLVGSKAAATYLGAAGTYAAGVLAGMTDVDAITLSMAKLAGAHVPPDVAVTTIFLGAVSNTVVKGVMAAVVGGWRFGRVVLGAQVATLAAGAAGLALAWLS